MRKTYYILISLVIFISCKTENRIDGIWMGAYRTEFSENDTSFFSVRLLMDISNDKLVVKTFDYQMFSEKDTIEIFEYSILGNNLIYNSDTFLIKNLTKDSLVLSLSKHGCDFIFKKLIEENKNLNVNVKNNSYSLIGPNYADSIDFVDDSIILHTGNTVFTYQRSTKWAINSYKSFDFLIFEQIEAPPFLIDNASENELSLKLFVTSIKDFKMTRIESVKDTTMIIGNWVSPFQKSNKLPLPPPPPNCPKDVDTKLYLTIRKDTIEIEQFGQTHSKEWKLNSTNDFIYFPEDIMTKNGVWKILKIEDNVLVIERNKKYSRPGHKEKIQFERIKNSR